MTKRFQSKPHEAGRLLVGEDAGTGSYGAYRPRGTRDWTMLTTLGHRGRFAMDDDEIAMTRGDLLLVRPGTPEDYGNEPTLRKWHNIWVHFVPRPQSIDWLDWPQLWPGVMRLRLEEQLLRRVVACLRSAYIYSKRNLGLSQELAANAVERAMLLADAADPNAAMSRFDARIRRVIDHVAGNLQKPATLASLAGVAGLSRSRFALLFEQQVGVPAMRYLETQRLSRAKRLLESSRYRLDEIAAEVGFASPFYFSLRFKKWLGVSPSDYRKRH